MFYEFTQNNSGGSFDFDAQRGITHRVIIEAESQEQALSKAEEIGLYFNGCVLGIDCFCCGDRWYKSPYEVNDLDKFIESKSNYVHLHPDIYVHYLDGRLEGHL